MLQPKDGANFRLDGQRPGETSLGPHNHIASSQQQLTGNGSNHRPRVSLMIPCFNEEESLQHVIPGFIEELSKDLDYDFELLFIDDHSNDQTPILLSNLCQHYPSVRAIRLGRNCGSHTAYRSGLDYCTGDAVAFTVADLQEGIELIRQSLKLWKEGTSVIGTVAIGRDRGSLFNEAGARLFYWLRQRLGRSISRDAAEAALRVIDRDVVDHCKKFAPRTRNINTWIFGQPFSVQFLRYVPTQRRYGSSKWTFRKKLQLVIDTLLDGSPIFLTVWLTLGGILLATGLAVLGFGIIQYITRMSASGNSSLALLVGTIVACTGLILTSAGTLGIYVWRIMEEMRGGPGYFAQPLGGNWSEVSSPQASRSRFLPKSVSSTQFP